jgi:hypothetical protein
MPVQQQKDGLTRDEKSLPIPPQALAVPQSLPREMVDRCLRVRADGKEGFQNYCNFTISFNWCWLMNDNQSRPTTWRFRENTCETGSSKRGSALRPNEAFDIPADRYKPYHRSGGRTPQAHVMDATRLPS